MAKLLTDAELNALAARVGEAMESAHLMLAAAESCTGGWVARVLTSVPGSSNWFERGFVTYSNAAKSEMLGVSSEVLERQGAVSEAVVRAMVQGAVARSHAKVAVAITGIAGPTGGTPEKPVGTVWFAWTQADREIRAERYRLDGDREAVRRQSVAIALEGLLASILGAPDRRR
jgi:nicotinamide-nucleotide amidase